VTTTPRIGYRMRQLHDVVSAMPGVSKRGVLALVGLPLSGPGRDAPVHRAVAAGLILVERERRNRYRLFATERDRAIFHLRAEALRPGCPAERVAEIRAEIGRLDAERAATWRYSD
jgi:hypothetical protein